MNDLIEKIAQQWDGCKYDAPGGSIDIGAAIRATAAKHVSGQEAELTDAGKPGCDGPWPGHSFRNRQAPTASEGQDTPLNPVPQPGWCMDCTPDNCTGCIPGNEVSPSALAASKDGSHAYSIF